MNEFTERRNRIAENRSLKAEHALVEAGYLEDGYEKAEDKGTAEFSTALIDFLVDSLHLANRRGVSVNYQDLLATAQELYRQERLR